MECHLPDGAPCSEPPWPHQESLPCLPSMPLPLPPRHIPVFGQGAQGLWPWDVPGTCTLLGRLTGSWGWSVQPLSSWPGRGSCRPVASLDPLPLSPLLAPCLLGKQPLYLEASLNCKQQCPRGRSWHTCPVPQTRPFTQSGGPGIEAHPMCAWAREPGAGFGLLLEQTGKLPQGPPSAPSRGVSPSP